MSGIVDVMMSQSRFRFLHIFGFLLTSMGGGALLASASVMTVYALGWIGALALIGWALVARQRWQALYELNGSEPGAPERVTWQRLAGYSLIFGHMAFGFANPQYDLHVGSGNYLAIDNWTLILGMLLSAMVFRADSRERDERDDQISAFATLWGYRSLIGLLVMLLTFVGFLPPDLQPIFNHFVVANLMVGTIILSLIVRQVTHLFLYARDSMARL
jgi:hypothetical protein